MSQLQTGGNFDPRGRFSQASPASSVYEGGGSGRPNYTRPSLRPKCSPNPCELCAELNANVNIPSSFSFNHGILTPLQQSELS